MGLDFVEAFFPVLSAHALHITGEYYNIRNRLSFFMLQSSGIGGCAHLVNFQGTDTLSGVMTARTYYGAEMAGHSIPAAEHR